MNFSSSSMNNSASNNDFNHYMELFFLLLRHRGPAQVAIESGLLIIINFVSVFGNIVLCWIMYQSSSLRTLTNIFILTLAASDIVTGLFCVPFSAAVLIQGKWVFGIHICRMQCFLIYFLGFGSLQTMTLVAVNRYYRIIKPNKYRKVFTFKSTITIVTIVWLYTALFLAIPFITKAVFAHFSPSKAACVMFRNPASSTTTVMSVNMVIVTLSTIIPTAIITFCYCRVFRLVGNHFTRVAPSLSSNSSSLRTSILEIKSTRTLFLVLLAFAVCWLPVFTIELIQTFFLSWWELPRSCHLLWTFCGSLSSAVNPFIFAATSRSFRKRFWALLKGGLFSENTESSSNTIRKRSATVVDKLSDVGRLSVVTLPRLHID